MALVLVLYCTVNSPGTGSGTSPGTSPGTVYTLIDLTIESYRSNVYIRTVLRLLHYELRLFGNLLLHYELRLFGNLLLPFYEHHTLLLLLFSP